MKCLSCETKIGVGKYCGACSTATVVTRPMRAAPVVAEGAWPDGTPKSPGEPWDWRGKDSIFYSSAQAERQARIREATERNNKK